MMKVATPKFLMYLQASEASPLYAHLLKIVTSPMLDTSHNSAGFSVNRHHCIKFIKHDQNLTSSPHVVTGQKGSKLNEGLSSII